MTPGMLLLILLAIGVFCGLLQRVLDRMYLTDRQALVIVALMLVGTFIPNIDLGSVAVNIGGAIPIGICVYLVWKADSAPERMRALIGSLITACAVFFLSIMLPTEAEALLIDPLWLYGLSGGVIAWLSGRSRRSAYICGTLGILIADCLNAGYASMQGYTAELVIGGGGIADAMVISGVFAVLICELVGEAMERLVRRRTRMSE